jgi:hypothetical protein
MQTTTCKLQRDFNKNFRFWWRDLFLLVGWREFLGEILYSLGGDHCWWKELCLLGEEIYDSCCCCCLIERKDWAENINCCNQKILQCQQIFCKKALSAHEFATSAATVAAAVVQQSAKKDAAVAGSGTHHPQQQQS